MAPEDEEIGKLVLCYLAVSQFWKGFQQSNSLLH